MKVSYTRLPQHNAETYDLQVESENHAGDFMVTFASPEKTLQLHWESPYHGWVLDHQTQTRSVFYAHQSVQQCSIWLNGQVYLLQRESLASSRRVGAIALATDGCVKAPMPGKILSVLVTPGDNIEAKAPLVLMESMKMEMTLSAPIDGRVENVYIATDDMVEMNTVLVVVKAVKA